MSDAAAHSTQNEAFDLYYVWRKERAEEEKGRGRQEGDDSNEEHWKNTTRTQKWEARPNGWRAAWIMH